MMDSIPRIWVLTDGRAGTDNQSLGVAEKLGLPFEEKRLRFGWAICLPPPVIRAALSLLIGLVLFFAYLSWRVWPVIAMVIAGSRSLAESAVILPVAVAYWPLMGALAAPLIIPVLLWLTLLIGRGGVRAGKGGLCPPWPDITISAGRRTARASLWLKRQKPDLFMVQLMRPGAGTRRFDVLAIPAHDRPRPSPNLLITRLAPHRLTHAALEAAARIWEPHFSSLPAPRVGILIGGTTRRGGVMAEDIRAIMDALPEDTGSLLVSTSRRTGPETLAALRAALEASGLPHFLYTPAEGGENPYLGILALTDRLIVTGDSLSMVSEACFTEKPVSICEPRRLPAKHRRMLASVFEDGQAVPLGQPPHPAAGPMEDAASAVAMAAIVRLRAQEVANRHRAL